MNKQQPHDHIVRSHHHRVVAQRDAVAGGGLAGDGDARLGDSKRGLERDRARQFEDDGPWPRGLDRGRRGS